MKTTIRLKQRLRLLVESWQRKFTKLPVKSLVILKKEIRIANYVGGTDKSRQIEKLQVNNRIVIGTPGRIYDLVILEICYS